MLIRATCKKCGGSVYFDIGDKTREETEEILKKNDTWNCTAGNHVEIMSPLDLYDFDWDHPTDKEAPSEEQFVSLLKDSFRTVLTLEQLSVSYNIESISTCGALCTRKDDEDAMVLFDFKTSPNGVRYYVADL